jgi:phosphoribosylaminoimidazolecarboxamide formyltransferase/IMP cyclohydrolase
MQRLALLSVSDKSGLVPFAQALVRIGFKIVSTGGTSKTLRAAGLEVTDVSTVTGHPEIMDGRVKTLHPRIHGGLLFDRMNAEHIAEREQHQIPEISLVVVNLYPFKPTTFSPEDAAEKIELIDIGGPAMLRAGAKNFMHVLTVVDPNDYDAVAEGLQNGGDDFHFRKRFAAKTFDHVSRYDRMIADSLMTNDGNPASFSIPPMSIMQKLRYGENPHQSAFLLGSTAAGNESEIKGMTVLQGKELSYNNLLDLSAAMASARDFSPHERACCIVKHNTPCGASASSVASTLELYEKALKADSESAFGGIVAFNCEVDEASAKAMSNHFFECIVAPDFSAEAKQVFAAKKNLRILVAPFMRTPAHQSWQFSSVLDGMLAQQRDTLTITHQEWRLVSGEPCNPETLHDLQFAMRVCRHVKSNAIVLAKGSMTIGIGGGQTSRINALKIAIQRAKDNQLDINGATLASDAFFPFADCVKLAAEHGIRFIVQPGGSIRDQESIDAANAAGVTMYFSGTRHFRH